MNEPTTKEEALRLLDQLQSKFNISKRDINESFNKSIEDSNNAPTTKIRLISVDEALFKIIIPWNKDKLWNNKKENYPSNAFHNNKWFIYFDTWNMRNEYEMNKINLKFRTTRGSTENGSFLSEYCYWYGTNRGYEKQPYAIAYQDNHKDNQEIRWYNEFTGRYSIEGHDDNTNYQSKKKW